MGTSTNYILSLIICLFSLRSSEPKSERKRKREANSMEANYDGSVSMQNQFGVDCLWLVVREG